MRVVKLKNDEHETYFTTTMYIYIYLTTCAVRVFHQEAIRKKNIYVYCQYCLCAKTITRIQLLNKIIILKSVGVKKRNAVRMHFKFTIT